MGNESEPLLDGIAFDAFRSFPRGTLQTLGPLGRLNVIVGPNNAGKSNVLRLLHRLLPLLPTSDNPVPSKEPEFGRLDAPDMKGETLDHLGYAIVEGTERWTQLRSSITQWSSPAGDRRPDVDTRILEEFAASGLLVDGQIWVEFERTSHPQEVLLPMMARLEAARQRGLSPRSLRTLERGSSWNPGGGGDSTLRSVASALLGIARPSRSIPVVYVPADRGLKPEHDQIPELGSLATWIRGLQAPSYTDQEVKRPLFSQLNEFLSRVLEVDAALHMPATGDQIEAVINGRQLPIVELGSGIEQTVYLAIRATQVSRALVMIEEPEIHLHPHLLLQLVHYLIQQTDNQYVLATHSAALLDHPEASVFAVTMADGQSALRHIRSPSERHVVVHDLGYRPSDLVHANTVIWVEGSSDRLYLKWWFACADHDFVEGIDYQIMFYGGRLLAATTVSDEPLADFADDLVRLQHLNRMLAVVIDSDRAERGRPLNATKQRLLAELAEPAVGWVTAGREIENYLPRPLLDAAVSEVHAGKSLLKSWGRYSKFEPARGGGPFRKVDIARAVTRTAPSEEYLQTLDLNQRIADLAAFIQVGRRRAGRDIRGSAPGCP